MLNSKDYSVVRKIYLQSLGTYILSDIAYTSGPLVDGIVTGNFLGVQAVAANCLVMPAVLVFTFMSGILSKGSRSIYTELLGRVKLDEANSVFTLANTLSVIVSLVIAAAGMLFAEQIMHFLGASGQNSHLTGLGADYLRGYLPGLVFLNSAKLISDYMTIDSDYSRNFYAVTAMTVVNIAGDFFTVLFTDWGMFGLGLATSISEAAYFGVMALHFTKKDILLHFTFRRTAESCGIIWRIFCEGSMSGLSKLGKAIAGIMTNNIIVLFAASSALAVYGVQKQVLSLFGSLYLGSAETILVMTSVYHGEEDKFSLDQLQIFSMKTGIFLASLCSAVIFVFSDFLAGMYIGHADSEVLALSSEAVKCVALTLPVYVYVFGLVDYLQGVKRFREANVYTIMVQIVMPLISLLVMIKIAGVRGVWWALPVSAVLLAVLGMVYISRQYGEKFRIKRLLLSPKFWQDEGKELELVADSMLEVSGMSGLSMKFCEENGFSKRTSMLLSLCIEEMGRNIIQYGFSDGKQHYIYLRILAKAGEVILRIRDDCKPFNPLERYRMTIQDENDPAKNIGIRLVMNLSSEVEYLSTFGTNNLIIRIPDKRAVV
ncbi:MAG: ATP-binding protein [Synergistaceae bacterium]|nr:ATP-binding protein [Synergistaceae bacterium]